MKRRVAYSGNNQEDRFKMSVYNEERVRVAVDEVEFQMTPPVDPEELAYVLELLHDPWADQEELNEKIMENLSGDLIEELTDDDLAEIRRRLRKIIKPEPEPEPEEEDEEDEETEEETRERLRASVKYWDEQLELSKAGLPSGLDTLGRRREDEEDE